jgi:hypothetical protein
MAEDYRKDSAAEQAFRQAARDLNVLLAAYGMELGRRAAPVTEARDALYAAADHIVAAWN